MRRSLLPLAALLLLPFIPPAGAQRAPARAPAAEHKAGEAKPAETKGPKSIGKFEDWQAATYQEAGQTVCYAFTRPTASQPAMKERGNEVVLTVTQRPNLRDAVAISVGFAYPANAEVAVQADQTSLPFYTSGRSAFARDGRAAVAAFQKARATVVKSPAPRGTVTDNFSLKGFSAAYAAIGKACPAR